ncbi:MAG: hypothetical protein G8D58_09725 [gamma proteobacterium symbiont of Phacoides pectinatus]
MEAESLTLSFHQHGTFEIVIQENLGLAALRGGEGHLVAPQEVGHR